MIGQAGFLAYGSFYSPRLPGRKRSPFSYTQWRCAAFIAVYSCGTAKDSHLLPYYLPGEHLNEKLFSIVSKSVTESAREVNE
jgi:hypothetical protein